MDENSVSVPRAKRQKKDKLGKNAAFEKLRQLKGSKNKYEINDVDSIYEVVDENEYSKRVLERQCDDWIVDDNGSGYYEDGREVFDDDLDSESIAAASKEKGKGKKKKAVSDISTPKGNLQYMLSTMQTKKKEDKKLNEDHLLKELILELDNDELSNGNSSVLPKTSVEKSKPHYTFTSSAKKQAAKEYIKSFDVSSSASDDKEKLNVTKKPSEIIFKEIQHALQPEVNSSDVLRKEDNGNKKCVGDNKIKECKDVENTENEVDKILGQTINDNQTQNNDNTKEILNESKTIFDSNNQESLLDDDFDLTQIEDNEFNENETFNDPFMDHIDHLVNEYETMQENGCNNAKMEVDVDISKLPLVLNEDGIKVFRFYWWDAFEDQNNKPGFVLLFGKVYNEESSSYISCCVVVRNIDRKIYLLPRPQHKETQKPVTLIDVYNEFNDTISNELNLDTFKSKKTTKSYCFDPEVPVESEYLEVRYSAKYPAVDPKRSGETFSRVFGTKSSFLEIFLLERKIKGPCWLDVTNPESVSNPMSWCKFEVNCNKVSDISVVKNSNNLPPPPLVVAAINVKTVVNPKYLRNEIVMISCLVNDKYYVDKQAPKIPFQKHFCVLTRPGDRMFPIDFHESVQNYKATKVQKTDSERSLINYFINQFSKLDPDLIVGHDLLGYQIPVLCQRLVEHKVNTFSKFSRIKRSIMPYKQKNEQLLFTGRLVCDIKVSAKELIKSRSFDLQTLCQNVLKITENQRVEIDPEDIPKCYQDSTSLLKLVSFTMQDTLFVLKIMYELNVIPLALQITNIAGNVMSRTLMGGRSERNEFLLLHAFYEKDYIVPDKYAFKKNKDEIDNASSRKKPTYSGGLVLDPKVGFYDRLILLMDFNSLYPSIIQEYNICFTTIADTQGEDVVLPDKSLPPGILPTEIRKLVESRRAVKKLMNNLEISNDLRMQYNIRQMALKLTANSMYGCLGFSNSRFFAKHLAALVTYKGREILTSTRDLVQKMAHEVIYGDTDSIMINTNCLDYDQVMQIGLKIKQEVNKLYRQVELDIDGVFKYLLLLKKKKYAAVIVTKSKSGQLVTTQEHKGLDLVRRDWSQLAAEAGKFILNCIFRDHSLDERIENIQAHLRKLREDLENGKVPLSLLIITKQLTKDPETYAGNLQLPHVQVALRHNEKGGKLLKAGDTVPYVICEDGTKNSHVQRAYHVDELKNSEDLKIDVKYYLAQQIHPVVTRLCEPMEGIDAYEVANCLGLDNTAFKKPKDNNQISVGDNLRSKEIVFRNVDFLTFKCMSCKTVNVVNDVNKDTFFEKCLNLNCSVRPIEYLTSVQNQLILSIRRYIAKYYENEFICEDPACPNETDDIPLKFVGKYPICLLCRRGVMYKKYSEKDLYTQLLYYKHLFDLNKHEKRKHLESNIENGFRILHETVKKYMKLSSYSTVNLTDFFHIFSTSSNSNKTKDIVIDEEFMVSEGEDVY
ncbi:DNA polymerase alpha catalytic subunit [Agrilus planipennis]|uniref:DNA polymerase n=1 Tax=Agrilus planipennis TaxID=224129 RepID=A0A1W4WWT3_AGRPL|nr:DNA polymerase alpha catalytic subunit [Agrilus planipennis]